LIIIDRISLKMADQKIRTLFQQLKSEWEKLDNTKNFTRLNDLIEKLKVEFLSASFMPSPGKEGNLDILVMQRDTLEIGTLTAVLKRDKEAFQCAFTQLKHYYNDVGKLTKASSLESPLKYQMLGLNLMYLLAENKLPEFHMELERIPIQIANENPYVSTPMQLEQYLMEGTYNKIFLSKSNVPSPYYTYFIEILLDTVRDEIASCVTKAYDRLDVNEAARILFFDGKSASEDALKYAKKKGWRLSSDKSGFLFVSDKDRKTDECLIDKDRLVSNHIFYAKQLEMIV